MLDNKKRQFIRLRNMSVDITRAPDIAILSQFAIVLNHGLSYSVRRAKNAGESNLPFQCAVFNISIYRGQ